MNIELLGIALLVLAAGLVGYHTGLQEKRGQFSETADRNSPELRSFEQRVKIR